MPLREKIYLNRDNSIKLGLTADGAAVDASRLTRVVAKLTDDDGNVSTFDSNSDSQAFDWTTETAQVSDTVTGIIVIRLQDAASPPAAGDDYTMNLIVYDDENPNGLYWDAAFPVQVISG